MNLNSSMGLNATTTASSAFELQPEVLLETIVEGTNKALHRNYSLVDFDKLKGIQLLQVLNDLFASLQPSMQADIESCGNAEEVLQRMSDFLLKTLGYRVPAFLQATFAQSFAEAESVIMYPILYWVITHMEQSRKRVYLARFLQPLEIPEEMIAADEDVRLLYAQYQQLRMTFVESHKRVEQLRSSFADPAELRRKVALLEEERDLLRTHIASAEKKLAPVTDKEALLAASHSLRVAREESAKLSEKLIEQEQAKITAYARSAEMNNRLQNIFRDSADGRVEMMIRRCKDEVQLNKIKSEETLPEEIANKERENNELQKLLSEPLDLNKLNYEDRQLDESLSTLHSQVRERQRPSEDGTSLVTIKQQVTRITARREEVIKELNSLQADNNKLTSTIRDKELQIEQLRTATSMLREEEFRDFANQVRAKKAATESMRARLAELRAEYGTLLFTQETLQSQFNVLDAEIGNLESKLGLQGYSKTVEALSKLTHEKDTIEEVKGKTLEELSKVVQDFTMAIREGRTKIMPMINELRSVRQTASEIDEEWNDKKTQYEYQQNLLMEDIHKIDDEVTRLKEETHKTESLYHQLQSQQLMLDVMKARAEQERQLQTQMTSPSRLSPEEKEQQEQLLMTLFDGRYRSYEECFADNIKQLENRSREAQARRHYVEESHEHNVQQVQWFAALQKILDAKLQVFSEENGENNNNNNNFIGSGGNDVDRTFLNDGINANSRRNKGGMNGLGNAIDRDIQQVFGGNKGGADMLVLND